MGDSLLCLLLHLSTPSCLILKKHYIIFVVGKRAYKNIKLCPLFQLCVFPDHLNTFLQRTKDYENKEMLAIASVFKSAWFFPPFPVYIPDCSNYCYSPESQARKLAAMTFMASVFLYYCCHFVYCMYFSKQNLTDSGARYPAEEARLIQLLIWGGWGIV